MLFRATSIALFAVLSLSTASMSDAFAQEIGASHLAIAKKAIAATRATDSFDNILLSAAGGLRDQLVSNNPDKAEEIGAIVNEEALKLAPRRGALEKEAARLFANSFSESELAEIAAFFATDTGKKYLDNTPILARELSKAARTWANGINRDLQAAVSPRVDALVK